MLAYSPPPACHSLPSFGACLQPTDADMARNQSMSAAISPVQVSNLCAGQARARVVIVPTHRLYALPHKQPTSPVPNKSTPIMIKSPEPAKVVPLATLRFVFVRRSVVVGYGVCVCVFVFTSDLDHSYLAPADPGEAQTAS